MSWITQRISRTCEVLADEKTQEMCGRETAFAYKAIGSGWMALCQPHSTKHLDYSKSIETLLLKGEQLKLLNEKLSE